MIEKLHIYKATYLLTTKIYSLLPTMERMHRHGIGARMADTAVSLFAHISLANKAFDRDGRLQHLDGFLATFEELRTMIRICADMKLLKISSLADLFLMVEDISKQLSGWIKSTSRMGEA